MQTIRRCGEPVYSYSLKQGIQDGFLAPYKVIKVHIDRDVEGYRPEKGQLDRDGNEVEDRIYNRTDFDRTLVIDDRTRLVAKKVTEFLKESGDRFQKAIIFCVDTEHAAEGLPLDPLAEQHRIVAKVEKLLALYDQLETQLTTVQAERHRLLEAVLHQALN